MSARRVFGDRPAETDFEIVGMRAKNEQLNVHRHGRLDYPNSTCGRKSLRTIPWSAAL